MRALIFIALTLTACAPSRDIRTDEPIAVESWEGPPCRVTVRVGAELVLDARSPRACRVQP